MGLSPVWDLGTVHKLVNKNWIRLIIPLLNALGGSPLEGFQVPAEDVVPGIEHVPSCQGW